MPDVNLVVYPGVLPSGDPPPAAYPPISSGVVAMNPALWPLANVHYLYPWSPARLLNLVAESCYLLAAVDHRPGQTMTWTPFGMASPPHLSRFLTESLGLAMTLQTAALQYGWMPSVDVVLNVDDVRVSSAPSLYAALHPVGAAGPPTVQVGTSSKARSYQAARAAVPDFVFVAGNQLIAAEARGRSGLASVHPTPKQQERAADLAHWGQRANNTQWFMSWIELTSSSNQLTVFDPGVPLELDGIELASVRAAEQARYDHLLASAVEDELPVTQGPGGIIFAWASQRVPGRGPAEWLTVAVSNRVLPGARSLGGPDRDAWPTIFDAAVVAAAATSRMVTALTATEPDETFLAQLFELVARPSRP